MNILTYFIKILRRVIYRIIRRRRDTYVANVEFDSDKRCLFNEKQLYVIDCGVKLGLNVYKYAKPKYTAEQMRILMYAQMLDVDTKGFDSYSMSAYEMEYQLYLATVDKYLGKGYLKSIMEKEQGTLTDSRIKLMIDRALSESLTALQEAAVSEFLIPELRKHDCKDASVVYKTITKLCTDRGIPMDSIQYSDDIEYLYSEYEQAFCAYICVNRNKVVHINNLNSIGTLQPTLQECIRRKDLLDTVEPVYIVNSHNKEKYYVTIIGDILYLCNSDSILVYSY